MKNETNDFWKLIDKLCVEHAIIVDRPKGTPHPKYSDFIYPLDYGYLEGTTSSDGGGIDVWIGSKGNTDVCGVITCVDYVKKDSEIKILIACSDEDMEIIMAETNKHDGMKGILTKRE